MIGFCTELLEFVFATLKAGSYVKFFAPSSGAALLALSSCAAGSSADLVTFADASSPFELFVSAFWLTSAILPLG